MPPLYAETPGGPRMTSAVKLEENQPRPDASYLQNLASHGPQRPRSRQNSTLFLYHTPRQDSFALPNGLAIGPPPTAPSSAQGQLRGFPNYYPGTRDSIPYGMRESVSFSVPSGDIPGRPRGDSIALPHPMSASSDPLAFPMTQVFPGSIPPRRALRATSIFSSLIQLPESSRNSVSGSSSRETGQTDQHENKRNPSSSRGILEIEPANKDSLGNILGWNQSIKRGDKLENQNAFWDQMAPGVSGSIAGVSNDSINAFLANLQSGGSIDFLAMSNEQRRDSIMKFISDQHHRPSEGIQPLETTVREGPLQTSLREDIFSDQRKSSLGSRAPNSNASECNHVSPTSSMLSKNSRLRDEPQSPKGSPGRVRQQLELSGMPLRDVQYAQPASTSQRQPSVFYNPQEAFSYPYQETSSQFQRPRPSYSQYLVPQNAHFGDRESRVYSNQVPPADNFLLMLKGSHFISPEAVEQPNYYPKADSIGRVVDESGKPLVQAQQYAKAEDGRPLLGATKVDQLMLVIQAREKGNTAAIKQGTDGSILASPNTDQLKSSVLPLSVDLVGGVDKPVKDKIEDESGEPSRKRKRRGKAQECPYCFKQFHQSTHLDVHVRSHIGLKPFECTFCGKRFTQGGNLRTHMRLHTGEKPFVCTICSRNFSRKGNLAAHMLTHNKEKPFECKLDNCDKSFTQLGNLKSHQNKFHLPTLTRLTQTFASITGDALAQLPEDEKQLLEYFAKLYKNANKGIRGRGKGKRVAKITNGVGDMSSPGSTNTSPEQLTIAMARRNDALGQEVKPSMNTNPNIPPF